MATSGPISQRTRAAFFKRYNALLKELGWDTGDIDRGAAALGERLPTGTSRNWKGTTARSSLPSAESLAVLTLIFEVSADYLLGLSDVRRQSGELQVERDAATGQAPKKHRKAVAVPREASG